MQMLLMARYGTPAFFTKPVIKKCAAIINAIAGNKKISSNSINISLANSRLNPKQKITREKIGGAVLKIHGLKNIHQS